MVEKGRRIDDTLAELVVGEGSKNKKRWKDIVGSGSRFQKVELSHVSGRRKRARKSQRERKRELGEARRMEVVGPTPVDGGDERRSRRRKRRSRWRVGEK